MMGVAVVAAVLALVVGMRLARLLDGGKSARADFHKAKTGLPGARKKARGATFAMIRYVTVLVLLTGAVIYGWLASNS